MKAPNIPGAIASTGSSSSICARSASTWPFTRATKGDAHFLQSVVGFVGTDMGLGLVLRAVRGRDGRPAPSLETLICERRFTDAARHDLETFIEHLRNSGVLIADFNAGNIVYGYDDVHGDHFVLIDGLGEKTLIPVKSMSRLLNRYSKWKHFRRLRAEIERLSADPSRRKKRKTAIPGELTSQAG